MAKIEIQPVAQIFGDSILADVLLERINNLIANQIQIADHLVLLNVELDQIRKALIILGLYDEENKERSST